MEFNEVIRTRRSVRKYRPEPVPEQYLMQMIEAAGQAPSAMNLQPWRYVIIKENAVIKKIAEFSPNTFIADSPALIICCLDPKSFGSIPDVLREKVSSGEVSLTAEYASLAESAGRDEAYINTLLYLNAGISFEHILLKAVDLGLGACWIGMFDADSVKRLVDIDDRYIVPALITVGYPGHEPAAKPRLPIGEILLKTI